MRKKVNVLDIKMPEKKEMKVKKIIDCSKDLIQVNAELKEMLENEDVEGMRKMMRYSTERRALFDKK